jgi:predicted MFS family arabinose efflux permease
VGNTASPLVAGPLARHFGAASLWPVIALLSLLSALVIYGIHAFDGRGKRRATEA